MVSRWCPTRVRLDLGLDLDLHLHLHRRLHLHQHLHLRMPENGAVVVAEAVLKIWHTTLGDDGAEPPPTGGHDLPSSPYCRPIVHHGSHVSLEGLTILTRAVHYILSPDIY